MNDSPFGNGDFLDFSDRLTGYRLSAILLLIEKVALFDVVTEQGETGGRICERIGWDRAYGKRLLDCLCRLGLLDRKGEHYCSSRFSRSFLCRPSPAFQGKTLQFERQLHHSWQQLDATLRAGQRIYAVEEKSPEELQGALALYLGAMDEAAALRAEELWQALPALPDHGRILDLGAGSGAFLAAFLAGHPRWSAIFYDLPQVVDSPAHRHNLAGYSQRISYCRGNLLSGEASELDDIAPGSCDLVLLSNLIHCQGTLETTQLLTRAATKTDQDGLLLIHDFFSDCGWRGALYDLHMMLNTYNGRTYLLQECVDMARKSGFCVHTVRSLPSGSTLLVFARSASVLHSLVP